MPSETDFSGHHVHIIGLGLMGGSLAMALGGKVRRITAEDRDSAILEQAIANQVIDARGERHLADVVVLAIPVHHLPTLIATLATTVREGATIIDLGSTKTTVCQALDELPASLSAVGGHPMCGLAENGFAHAIPHLYHGARFVLCETARTTPEACAIAEALVAACGANVVWMTRERHDFLTAVTSHLPHLLNFALMHLAEDIRHEDADVLALAAGGFDGATRLARTHASMITGMFTTNAPHLRTLAQQFTEHLQALITLFDQPDALEAALHEVVQARREYSYLYGERTIS